MPESQNNHTVVRVTIVLRWLNDLAFNVCVVFPLLPPDQRHHHRCNHCNIITTTTPGIPSTPPSQIPLHED
ncbi:hypothetical protein Hanom_Chr02g00107811 [Helianthus anomalus]